MYTDPKRVRNRQCLTWLNEYEMEEINAMVDELGGGKGPIIRDIVMRAVRDFNERVEAAKIAEQQVEIENDQATALVNALKSMIATPPKKLHVGNYRYALTH